MVCAQRGDITIAPREGVPEKVLSNYPSITPEIVERYIRLDNSATEAVSKAHPFFKETNKSQP